MKNEWCYKGRDSWFLKSIYCLPVIVGLLLSEKLIAQSPEFTSKPVEQAYVGEHYQYNITTKGWWFIAREIVSTGGKLPKGLKLTDFGNGRAVLKGVPEKPGKYSIELTVRYKDDDREDDDDDDDDRHRGSSDTQKFTLTVSRPRATIVLSDLNTTYDGKPHAPTVKTEPEGLKVKITYNGSSNLPTDAGEYTVYAVIDDNEYEGSATGTLVIGKAQGSITLTNLVRTYNGDEHRVAAKTTPEGLKVNITYNGAGNIPVDAGSYSVKAVINDKNYGGVLNATMTIHKKEAQVRLNDLIAIFDGEPKEVTVTTIPADLRVKITYDGAHKPPTEIGDYEVVATVEDKNYKGSASATFMIRDRDDVNVPPVISNLESDSLIYMQGNPGIPVSESLIINDFDDTHMYEAQIAIEQNYVQGEDILNYSAPVGNIKGEFDAFTGMLTLTGIDTRSNYELAIAHVTYENMHMGEPEPLQKRVMIAVKDSANYSQPVFRPISLHPFQELEIVSAFTPNGDAVNDSWDFVGLEKYIGISISVFNKDGKEVYKCFENNCAWDGRYNGKLLPPDVYFYVINLNNGRKEYKGTVTILR